MYHLTHEPRVPSLRETLWVMTSLTHIAGRCGHPWKSTSTGPNVVCMWENIPVGIKRECCGLSEVSIAMGLRLRREARGVSIISYNDSQSKKCIIGMGYPVDRPNMNITIVMVLTPACFHRSGVATLSTKTFLPGVPSKPRAGNGINSVYNKLASDRALQIGWSSLVEHPLDHVLQRAHALVHPSGDEEVLHRALRPSVRKRC